MSTRPNQDNLKLDSAVKKVATYFLRCFDAKGNLKQYWNKWTTTKYWIDITNERYKMPPGLHFSADNLTRAVDRDPNFNTIDIVKDSNMHGVNKASFKEQFRLKRRMLTAYYIITPKPLISNS